MSHWAETSSGPARTGLKWPMATPACDCMADHSGGTHGHTGLRLHGRPQWLQRALAGSARGAHATAARHQLHQGHWAAKRALWW
jgi:hypothetical protein